VPDDPQLAVVPDHPHLTAVRDQVLFVSEPKAASGTVCEHG
jgi:hypothetical protein